MMIGNPDGIAVDVMTLDIAVPAHATVDGEPTSADVTLAI
jgi:hypothetical protein